MSPEVTCPRINLRLLIIVEFEPRHRPCPAGWQSFISGESLLASKSLACTDADLREARHECRSRTDLLGRNGQDEVQDIEELG